MQDPGELLEADGCSSSIVEMEGSSFQEREARASKLQGAARMLGRK